jgi:hypothetical protein
MGTVALDASATQRIDAIKEAELDVGKKVVVVPVELRQQLVNEGFPDMPQVRLVRMNPARRRQAAELVQRRYYKDLKDDALPSDAQVAELAAKRGEWTAEHEARRKQLGEESQQLMLGLYSEGFGKGAEVWAAHIEELTVLLREALAPVDGEPHPLRAEFETWRAWVADQPTNDPAYNPDSALQRLYDGLPAFGESLEELDTLKDRVNRYWKLVTIRNEQNQLELRRAQVFDQTVESRRSQCEEYARLYTCAEVLAADGLSLGPICKEFDHLWNLPFDVLTFLTTEAYLFANGIPDEAREYLETWGFLVPTSPDSPKPASDASPDVGMSNSDGVAAATTPSTTSA